MEPRKEIPPCEVHSLHPHDHSWLTPELRLTRECSGRFWCGRCRRWLDGPRCKLAPVGKAA